MIYTSPDAQWIAVRRPPGRDVRLLPGLEGAQTEDSTRNVPRTIALEEDDAELAFVGTPSALVAIARTRVTMYPLHAPEGALPDAEPLPPTWLALDVPMRLAAITGPRLALIAGDHKRVVIVRVAGRALATQVIDHQSPVELAVGLDRNQLLFGLMRRLEVWDAVSARPLLRLQLQLPPPPRTVGAAQGHLWATRPGSDEIFIYRLSDGRPFRHHAGSPIEDVVCHPGSPVLVLVTARGLVRLHCFAHSLALLEAPWQRGVSLAQLAAGSELFLVGDSGAEPWRIAIGAAASARPIEDTARAPEVIIRPPEVRPPPPPDVRPVVPPSWRDALVAIGHELAHAAPQLPVAGDDTELGELARRLQLGAPARRALIALYAAYLVGEPAVSIAQLARVLGDYTEALGQGELHALAMLRRRGGRVALRGAVSDLLDGISPRAVRVVGRESITRPHGAARFARDGKPDHVLESELAARLGRIAMIEGSASVGLLEARLLDATAIAIAPPPSRPVPWPRDAALIVVTDAASPDWVASLPTL